MLERYRAILFNAVEEKFVQKIWVDFEVSPQKVLEHLNKYYPPSDDYRWKVIQITERPK